MSTKFNEDELHPPDWMNENFFTKVLRKYEKNDKILVKDVQISPASAQGDHYGSVMFRGAVTYDTQKSKGNSKSLIIKTMPELDGYKKDLLREMFIFETEISMYAETIPKLEDELRIIGDQTVLGAEVLYYSLEPKKIIIFEDICPQGYEVLRDRHCNMEEVKAAFLKLAKWHAVSYKLAAEGDTSLTAYKESMFAFKGIEEMPFMTTGFTNFIDKLESIDEFKQYLPKLRSIKKDILKSVINSSKISQQKESVGIFVLCHGDFHRKNMMFKHNSNGKVEDVLLLDYQISYYGLAVFDVLVGMHMLLDDNMRINCYDEIIYCYSSNFIETLRKLNFQGVIPKISDFFIDILRHRHWELFLMSSFLPIWNVFAPDDQNPEDTLTSNEARRKAYDNDVFINEVRKRLPMMLYRGYLE